MFRVDTGPATKDACHALVASAQEFHATWRHGSCGQEASTQIARNTFINIRAAAADLAALAGVVTYLRHEPK